MIIPVILSGGSGTRLWPLSRSAYPKQFIPLIDDHSLFQETVERMSAVPDAGDVLVVCNEEHRFMVAEQIRQLDMKPSG
ncbi:MAG: NTP transferase domain-containing protein, partial [Candidatus Thiodiazotropha sp. (ex Cardiolucina cf. quadrata)]|nr:NTP transferase domain-containing protein [Candidatus Thiodiazotropha sp. (ex Cardiolucina cf. quadrata)]